MVHRVLYTSLPDNTNRAVAVLMDRGNVCGLDMIAGSVAARIPCGPAPIAFRTGICHANLAEEERCRTGWTRGRAAVVVERVAGCQEPTGRRNVRQTNTYRPETPTPAAHTCSISWNDPKPRGSAHVNVDGHDATYPTSTGCWPFRLTRNVRLHASSMPHRATPLY